MTAIAVELDEKLKTLDPVLALSLEKLVRNAIDLVKIQPTAAPSTAAKHWPPDFFKEIAAEFGDEPFERPPQGEFEKREAW